jgi:transposase
MEPVKIKKYSYFVGIDVSKNELDFAIMQGSTLIYHTEIKNDLNEIASLLVKFKVLPRFNFGNSVFCIKHTGPYCNPLLDVLRSVRLTLYWRSLCKLRTRLLIVSFGIDS